MTSEAEYIFILVMGAIMYAWFAYWILNSEDVGDYFLTRWIVYKWQAFLVSLVIGVLWLPLTLIASVLLILWGIWRFIRHFCGFIISLGGKIKP